MEIWKDVLGYEGLYQVSSIGRVKRLKGTSSKTKNGDLIRKPQPNRSRKGYVQVILSKGSKIASFHLARLVCAAFHGPCPEGMECAHKDGDNSNNTAENLTWKTHKANMKDQVEHGTQKFGEDHHLAKLTDEQVSEIRLRYKPYCKVNNGNILAREYGVTRQYIGEIVAGNKR